MLYYNKSFKYLTWQWDTLHKTPQEMKTDEIVSIFQLITHIIIEDDFTMTLWPKHIVKSMFLKQCSKNHYLLQWMPLNWITLGQTISDPFNRDPIKRRPLY